MPLLECAMVHLAGQEAIVNSLLSFLQHHRQPHRPTRAQRRQRLSPWCWLRHRLQLLLQVLAAITFAVCNRVCSAASVCFLWLRAHSATLDSRHRFPARGSFPFLKCSQGFIAGPRKQHWRATTESGEEIFTIYSALPSHFDSLHGNCPSLKLRRLNLWMAHSHLLAQVSTCLL